MIEWENSKLTIKNQCELIGLARSIAYHEPVEMIPSQDEVNIKNAIDLKSYMEEMC